MVLARFLPRDAQFFTLFREAAANAVETAQVLADMLATMEDVDRKARRLRDLEHRGDEITHQVFHSLNSTFVTPIDREDIRDLASQIDDFVDYIEEAGRRVYLYRISERNERATLFGKVLLEQAQILAEAVPRLEHSKERDRVLRYTVEINRLENEADDALSQALAVLYDGVEDIPALIRAIRWGELYQLLEDATDRAESVANTMEGIVLKNA
ncbi:MAG: DUF47 family protein [Sphaerobacter thermophilus]|jgi:predicted phosphate transport protein (TIGR00153 family)|uniref:DUF47 domain-containing protein n=1 Tax=Sphaerobacter thermophilus TaxID=2057 RepID=UPI000DB0B040|nr:MAG: DUF47 domain-containing protein [Sphaerobacter thermophilus]